MKAFKAILKEFNKVEVDTGITGAECKLKKNDIFKKEIEASIVFPENDDAVLHVFETQGLENTIKSDTDKDSATILSAQSFTNGTSNTNEHGMASETKF